jgi:ABC-type nitrate/sulfonate/bicarbonate transport system permease component
MPKLRTWGITVIAWVALLGIWELVARTHQGPGTLWPSPRTVLDTIADNPNLFWQSVKATLKEAVLGFGLGAGAAILLALMAQWFPPLRDSLYRASLTLYSIPLIALAPVLVSWVGPGIWTKVIIAALASFFPVFVNATQALRTTDAKALELMSVFGASRVQSLARVRVPYALPAVIASFKIAAPAAIIGAMLAEWVGAERGLGLIMLFSMFSYKVPQLWAALLIASALSVGAYYLFEFAGRLLFPWHGSARQAGAP